MSDFPSNIVARLVWDGWHRGRNVEPWDEVARLDRCGYPVFPTAWRFLVQFGRLRLWRDVGRQFAHGEPAALDLTLGEVAPPYDSREMQAITSGAGLSLCLVGAFVYPGRSAHSAVLLVDERGVFYRCMDHTYLDLIGHTPADMITNFYDGLLNVERVYTLVGPPSAGRPTNRTSALRRTPTQTRRAEVFTTPPG